MSFLDTYMCLSNKVKIREIAEGLIRRLCISCCCCSPPFLCRASGTAQRSNKGRSKCHEHQQEAHRSWQATVASSFDKDCVNVRDFVPPRLLQLHTKRLLMWHGVILVHVVVEVIFDLLFIFLARGS